MSDEKRVKSEEVTSCIICRKPTKLYCGYCSKTRGEFNPTYYCDEHYESVVMTGNCCRGSEIDYDE